MAVLDRKVTRSVPAFPALHKGQRVRFRPPLLEVELASLYGTVIGPDEDDGHYRIRLDVPGTYRPSPAAEPETITELVEASDNLDRLEDERWVEPEWIGELKAS